MTRVLARYKGLKRQPAITFEDNGIELFEIPEDQSSETRARLSCEAARMPPGW